MKYFALFIVALIAISAVYLAIRKNENETLPPPDATAEVIQKEATDPLGMNEELPTFVATGKQIAKNYFEFNKTDYVAAKQAKRPIFLFFYANWCPTCAKQEPVVVDMMNGLQGENSQIVAFRVNYNDKATDADEREMADQFGVRYQHTMFAIDANGVQIKKFLGETSKEEILTAFDTTAN